MGCLGNKKSPSDDKSSDEASLETAVDEMTQKRLNNSINFFLEEEQRKERGKLQILLLGAGESGKSTIFKQFRNLYGTPMPKDDIKMYGVVIRSNIITAIAKLCELARELDCESSLIRESEKDASNSNGDGQKQTKMTVKDAYDLLRTHLIDNNFTEPLPDISQEQLQKDWVGFNPRAGSKCNIDAVRCLQLVDAIELFWKVRFGLVYFVFEYAHEFCCCYLL